MKIAAIRLKLLNYSEYTSSIMPPKPFIELCLHVSFLQTDRFHRGPIINGPVKLAVKSCRGWKVEKKY